MGIQVEYNPDLALRNIRESREGRSKKEECIPENLESGKVFDFLKKGQRNYWLEGEMPLVETDGKQSLSRPKASVIILEASHLLIDGKPWTRGRYKVMEVFSPDDKETKFEGFERRK